jgi:hypothetical protein
MKRCLNSNWGLLDPTVIRLFLLVVTFLEEAKASIATLTFEANFASLNES